MLVELITSYDSIGWSSAGPMHDAQHCIHPAPFGRQCTVHEDTALATCLRLLDCNALTCPAPGPYKEGTRRHDGIRAPICQARTLASAAAWRGGVHLERKHGMCKPDGCRSYFLTDASSALEKIRAVVPALPATVVLLPLGSSKVARTLRLTRPLTTNPLMLDSSIPGNIGPVHAYALRTDVPEARKARSLRRLQRRRRMAK